MSSAELGNSFFRARSLSLSLSLSRAISLFLLSLSPSIDIVSRKFHDRSKRRERERERENERKKRAALRLSSRENRGDSRPTRSRRHRGESEASSIQGWIVESNVGSRTSNVVYPSVFTTDAFSLVIKSTGGKWLGH